MPYIDKLGLLAFGSRLKRLSDTIMHNAVDIYKSLGYTFEAHWFAIFHLLANSEKPLTISDITMEIGFSHPAIIKITNSMIKEELLKESGDRHDNRKRLLSLTRKGKTLYSQLEPVWNIFEIITEELLRETDPNMLKALDKIDLALKEFSLFDRFMQHYRINHTDPLLILDFNPQFKEDFKNLNLQWINKYFQPEEKDLTILSDPENEILQKGGFILFAEYQQQIVGTGALEKYDQNTFFISKMAVQEDFQGKGIGTKLCQALINLAKDKKASQIYLLTDEKLTTAIKVYKKAGFKISRKKMPDLGYQRAETGLLMKLKIRD